MFRCLDLRFRVRSHHRRPLAHVPFPDHAIDDVRIALRKLLCSQRLPRWISALNTDARVDQATSSRYAHVALLGSDIGDGWRAFFRSRPRNSVQMFQTTVARPEQTQCDRSSGLHECGQFWPRSVTTSSTGPPSLGTTPMKRVVAALDFDDDRVSVRRPRRDRTSLRRRT